MNIKTNHGSYNISDYQSFVKFIQENQDWADLDRFLQDVSSGSFGSSLYSIYNQYLQRQEGLQQAAETGDWSQYQQDAAQNGWDMSAQDTEYLNNMIANQRTEEARSYDTQMRDTSLLSAGQQLSQLGLSTSNVIQTGGAASSGVSTAQVSNRNHSGTMALAKYNQKMQMAKTMIGMAGSMAAAGIHGAALGRVKAASSVLASSGAHSGTKALQAFEKASSRQQTFMTRLAQDNPDAFNKMFG